ncbi:MAG: PadR family transcriptional regulator [Candidatus Fermentibacteraceae bacterium]
MVKPDVEKAFMTDDGMPPEDRKFRKELSAGITALALLGIMDGATGPLYGYSVAKLMEEKGGASRIVKHGTLYPVLRSLEGAGLLLSSVEPSVAGPPRRYYTITPSGRDALGRWAGIWKETAVFMDGLLGGRTYE